jgi:hypothetical protein
VVVLGGGAAGVCAAATAAKLGRRTLLIEAGPMLGGELLSGMPVDGAVNARGQWIQGGVTRAFFDECDRMGGYIGPINDHRLIHYVAFDHEIMKLAVVAVLERHGVDVLLNSFVHRVNTEGRTVRSLRLMNKAGDCEVKAPVFLDCSGDGDLAALAGAKFHHGGEKATFQPISLIFRLSNVHNTPLLDFVAEHPDYFCFGESDAIRAGRSDAQLAQSLRDQGQPAVFFNGKAPLLTDAVARGEMFPTALIMIQPTSAQRREVSVNATRVANVDGLDTRALSRTMAPLLAQVWQCTTFLKAHVPGFEQAAFAGAAPRLGVRETRRIIGEYELTGQEVLDAKKSPSGVAQGCHHVDIHQDGTGQVRIPVADGGSYDIPLGCLIPQGLSNVLVAGRCLSADREAHGSARVMGSCMGMGQAIAAGADHYLRDGLSDVRRIDVEALRGELLQLGGVLS